MGKYKNIIIILIITVCINLLSSLDIGLLLIIILDSLGIITIIILAKSTNTYEEKIIDSISKLIYKILII